jgi:metal-responsive CopG/Arc/MetJ family transcriptional regulator
VNGNKNVTFSLPESLLHEFKVYAAKRNQSMTSLVAEAIEKLVKQRGDEYEQAKRRIFERLNNPFDLGTNGKIPWTRDEIHQRAVH